MVGHRPSRGTRVVYREVDSDESDIDYEEVMKVVTVEKVDEDSDDTPKQVVFPPLIPIQQQLRKVCRLGDKDKLTNFLTNNPDIDLDVRDPEGEDDDYDC